MTMGVCGYIESNGVKYWKPNMAAIDGDLGVRIVQEIRNAPRPDQEKLDAKVEAINARIRKARENGTY